MLLVHSINSEEMCGICGNADGNVTNDWMKPNGDNVPNQDNELGESWRVLWDDGW